AGRPGGGGGGGGGGRGGGAGGGGGGGRGGGGAGGGGGGGAGGGGGGAPPRNPAGWGARAARPAAPQAMCGTTLGPTSGAPHSPPSPRPRGSGPWSGGP
ncbi:hypothetical protein GO594_32115, partial [Pseudomonas otitidis]|nr:hypothetical protein [Pseudomonas otitidis]